jgi:hypothetical protein
MTNTHTKQDHSSRLAVRPVGISKSALVVSSTTTGGAFVFPSAAAPAAFGQSRSANGMAQKNGELVTFAQSESDLFIAVDESLPLQRSRFRFASRPECWPILGDAVPLCAPRPLRRAFGRVNSCSPNPKKILRPQP